MSISDKYKPCDKWTIAKGINELDNLSLVINPVGRIITYPRRIMALWDKSDHDDVGASHENLVMDKLCYLGTTPPIKYATTTQGEELCTSEKDIIVLACWDFIFDTKEEADAEFRNKMKIYKDDLESIVANGCNAVKQAKDALEY